MRASNFSSHWVTACNHRCSLTPARAHRRRQGASRADSQVSPSERSIMKTSILCSVLILSAFGCGGAPVTPPSTPTHDTVPVTPPPTHDTVPAVATGKSAPKAPGDAKVGDATTCPVSKEAFTVTESSPKTEYQGKTYYFCCGGCDKKFIANPKQYVSGGT